MFAKNPSVELLVEDSPDDADFARRALAKSGVPHRLVVAELGDEALRLLTEPEDPSTNIQPLRPSLILLDLNTPGMTGRELLRRIKTDDALCTIPVVVLSTSRHRSDIESCYQVHANSYHAKSDDLAAYQKTLRQVAEYWLEVVVPVPAPADSASEPGGLPRPLV